MMIDRRNFVGLLASLPIAAAACAAPTDAAEDKPVAVAGGKLLTRSMPGAKRPVPIVGLGTARNWVIENDADRQMLRTGLARFAELGGQLIDTAPSYGGGRTEPVLGRLIEALGIRDRLYLATKVGVDSREQGLAQIEESFRRLRTKHIDLIAVHNIRDVDNQLAILRDLKREGRIGALGITTSFDNQYSDFEAVMRRQPLDVIQVDYAIDNRGADERILPLARDKGLAVMINVPFGRGALFERVRERPLPDWAKEIDATSWAQIFLKYVLSHPTRPFPIPGMRQARHVEDNLSAARGRMPDQALRRRMEQVIDSL
jgi:aryl-alcohol dehydrogenase-like predicted oxidoreductase